MSTVHDRPTRDNIPDPILREVRQRCGFGCVVCGLPLYEYDHLLGWANVHRHVAEEITLLCDQHHREKTSGLLPFGVVLQCNDRPFNLSANALGLSKPYALHYVGSTCTTLMGSNVSTMSQGTVSLATVVIDDESLLGFRLEDGHYLLNARLYSRNDELLLEIKDNHLKHVVDVWDVEFVGRRIKLRTAKREIFVDLEFQPPHTIHVHRGRLFRSGIGILVRPNYLAILNNKTLIYNNRSIDLPVFVDIGDSPHRLACVSFNSETVTRYTDFEADERAVRQQYRAALRSGVQ